MPATSSSRRTFLKTAALASAGAAWVAPASAKSVRPPMPGTPLQLGIASYSTRKLSRQDTFKLARELGTANVNIKSFHLDYDADILEVAAFQQDVADAGIRITGGGVVTMKEDADAPIEAAFHYARAAGMPMMVIAPTFATLPRIEHFVKKFGIAVAIHNHGPEDKLFPTGASALPHISKLDARVGVCLDIGHSARSGSDLVAEVAELGPRLLDLHVKDLTDLSDKSSICVVGDGIIPIAPFMRQLMAVEYRGYVNLEYEIDAENPRHGMHRSFAFMRGVAAGLVA